MISNIKMEDITKIVKSLNYSILLLKRFNEIIQHEAKNRKEGFLV